MVIFSVLVQQMCVLDTKKLYICLSCLNTLFTETIWTTSPKTMVYIAFYSLEFILRDNKILPEEHDKNAKLNI